MNALVDRLGFLALAKLLYLKRGTTLLLSGLNGEADAIDLTPPIDPPELSEGRVFMERMGKWIQLWPLCDVHIDKTRPIPSSITVPLLSTYVFPHLDQTSAP